MSVNPWISRRPVWLPRFFMSPRDIELFLRSARTDAAIAKLGPRVGYPTAFEMIYSGRADPWASNDDRFTYQRHKYDALIACLPLGKRYGRVLDLGCGLGLFSRKLAQHAGEVVGIDIAQAAVEHATDLSRNVPNVRFERGDLTDLPYSLNAQFDLVVLADTIYYLPPPLNDHQLKLLAYRVAELLTPGGCCLLANHYFFAVDPASRVSRRIHQAFAWSSGLNLLSNHRRPFYLSSLLAKASGPVPPNLDPTR
jgi:SAM-dependent methyltransferase